MAFRRRRSFGRFRGRRGRVGRRRFGMRRSSRRGFRIGNRM